MVQFSPKLFWVCSMSDAGETAEEASAKTLQRISEPTASPAKINLRLFEQSDPTLICALIRTLVTQLKQTLNWFDEVREWLRLFIKLYPQNHLHKKFGLCLAAQRCFQKRLSSRAFSAWQKRTPGIQFESLYL